MAEDEGMFNLATILKIAGSVPILLGIMIIFNPTGSLVNGDQLTDSGLIIGRYVGMLAIIFGLSHWVVSMYTTENLHIFARFFAIGHVGIGGMDMWNYFLGNVEYDASSIVGSIFPFALAIILLINSRTSE
jgi:NhaP-type Na+/H+ or K+/H+ antiporter